MMSLLSQQLGITQLQLLILAALAHQDVAGVGKALEECWSVGASNQCLRVHETADVLVF